MEIRELKANELDYAVLPCVDPEFRGTMKEGMDLRRDFLRKKRRYGLSVLVALEEVGNKERINYPGVGKVEVKDLSWKRKIVAGLIEYIPIEKTIFPVKGKNLAFVHCIWVIPPYWKKGVAKALMENFLERTSQLSGSAVIAYEGESWWGFFDYMPTWFFTKFGFKETQRNGGSVLMFKNYGHAKPPALILSKPGSALNHKKTSVEFFWSNQCPYSWWVAKFLEKEFGKSSKFRLKMINTDRRTIVQKFGLTFGLRINGNTIFDRISSWDEVKKTLKSV